MRPARGCLQSPAMSVNGTAPAALSPTVQADPSPSPTGTGVSAPARHVARGYYPPPHYVSLLPGLQRPAALTTCCKVFFFFLRLRVFSVIVVELVGMDAWMSRLEEARRAFLEDDEDDEANLSMAFDQL